MIKNMLWNSETTSPLSPTESKNDKQQGPAALMTNNWDFIRKKKPSRSQAHSAL